MKLSIEKVLIYQPGRKRQHTVKKYYNLWREKQTPPLPLRCDNDECYFHNNPLKWNSKPLSIILDHKNGVNGDNRPNNLQYLCPNCNSQQSTHGGGNKGKVKQDSGGYALIHEDGKRDYFLPVETAEFKVH